MAIDLSRFIATFFDEAQEHLESIEEHAMALGSGRGDAETLNAIFRAAHSIKGGSGTFGFTQLSEVTHEMETLFDGLRKGVGRADESTVRLLLDACDVFKAHLARLKAGDRGEDPAMRELGRRLVGSRPDSGTADAGVPAAPPAAAAAPTEESFFTDGPAPPAREPQAAKPAAASWGLFSEDAAPKPAETEKYGLF